MEGWHTEKDTMHENIQETKKMGKSKEQQDNINNVLSNSTGEDEKPKDKAWKPTKRTSQQWQMGKNQVTTKMQLKT